MLQKFNLLIATSRGNERNSCSELWYLLGELGDRSAMIDTTGIVGLVVAQTEFDPICTLEEFRRKLIESPWKFRYILKVTPIQRVIASELPEIAKCVSEISDGIESDESFRITVEKRHTTLSSGEIIKMVAELIPRSVSLDTPDKIVLIEIVGDRTGISLIRPSGILSIEREKRTLGSRR